MASGKNGGQHVCCTDFYSCQHAFTRTSNWLFGCVVSFVLVGTGTRHDFCEDDSHMHMLTPFFVHTGAPFPAPSFHGQADYAATHARLSRSLDRAGQLREKESARVVSRSPRTRFIISEYASHQHSHHISCRSE